MNLKRYGHNINVALEAVFANRFRSVLTALGIIFGVGAVIAMLAIGAGAQKEILEQIKLVGVNNIIIEPVIKELDMNEKEDDKGFAPGLSLLDAKSIEEHIPGVKYISPEVIYQTDVARSGITHEGKLSGVRPVFFKVFNLELAEGNMFSPKQREKALPVCIIGWEIKARFFPKGNPIGQVIKCGNVWFEVIGVLQNRSVGEKESENLGISVYNNTIYSPIETVLLRYKDRSLVTQSMIEWQDESEDEVKRHNNQLDKIVVQVEETEQLLPATSVIRRMLKRRHNQKENFEAIIPELLLKQQQKTKDIFNIVLGAIAGISLLVGGIGIMNIMLASVMERTREIGIRRAIGATKSDVVFQFLAEATIISLTGGLTGIALGIALAKMITRITDILTVITPGSIIISFGVSVFIGLLFGYLPARRAANSDPVTALRYG
ncbi:MAG: ABC transporter permease [Candidatus Zixiibacteriota bacterium]